MAAQGEVKRVEVPAALVTNVGMASSGIVSSVLTALAGVTLDSLKPNITNYLGRNIAVAAGIKAGPIISVPEVIEAWLESDYTTIIDAIKAGIGQGVGSVHASLYEQLTATNALMSSYQGLIQRIGIDPFISRWVNGTIRPNIPDTQTAWFMKKIGRLSDEWYRLYLAENGWEDRFAHALEGVWTVQPSLDVLFDLRRRNLISEDALKLSLKWFRFDDGIIDMVANLVFQFPEPYRLAEMHSKGLTTWEEYLGTTRKFGLPDGWAANWYESQKRYPDFTMALELLRRGFVDEATVNYWMLRGQVDPAETEVMLKLKDVIPPIADLIRFAVREAYLDHDPEKQYSYMVEMAGKMGLSAEASEWYWYSHWDRIPINLMYANYHRGFWDKAKLERMLKIVDVHPDDRTDIINVAYVPPAIRELGYGFDVGVYTEEDIEKYRRWGGLSPEDAKKATAATVAYRLEAERNAVRTEYVYAYGRGKLTLEELTAKLEELKTPAQAVPLWIERAEWYRDRIMKPQMDVEGRVPSSAEVLKAYKLGLIGVAQVSIMLGNLDWTNERIKLAIEMADGEIAEAKAKLEEVKYRKLTLSQVRQMYSAGLLSKEQVTTEIIIMGYSPDDAELLTDVYTRVEAVEVKVKPFTSAVAASMYRLAMFDEDDLYNNFLMQDWTDEQAALLTVYTVLSQEYPLLRGLYEKGAITTKEFIDELKALEVPEFEAGELVKKTYREISIQRLSVERDLTKAEIIKGVKNQVLTPTQGVDLLVDIGYDQDEAWYILAINKVVAAGDPDGYWEMKRVTESYKKARGEKALEIPDELIMLEQEIKVAKAEVESLKKEGASEETIGMAVVGLNTLETRMRELITGLGLK